MFTVKVSVPTLAEPLSIIGVPTVAFVFRSITVVLFPLSWSFPVLDAPKVKVALAAGPNAVVLPAVTVPALTVVVPVYVFAPDSVSELEPL